MLPMLDDDRVLHRARDARNRWRLGESLAQFGMVAAAVVAFAVVLPDQLPVAVFDDRALERDLGVGQPMRGQIGLDAVAELRKVGRLLGEANPDKAADALAMHRLQPMRLGVEIGAHVAGITKPTVEFISPVVIGADELDDASLRRRANP